MQAYGAFVEPRVRVSLFYQVEVCETFQEKNKNSPQFYRDANKILKI